MCKTQLISRYELVEVSIPATATNTINFPTVNNLKNDSDQIVTIKDIEVFPNYVQTGSLYTQGAAGLPVAEIPKLSLVLYYMGGEFVRFIPLAKLIYTTPPAGTAAPFQQTRTAFDDLKMVMWEKCYVRYNTAVAGAPYVIPFGITYEKKIPV